MRRESVKLFLEDDFAEDIRRARAAALAVVAELDGGESCASE